MSNTPKQIDEWDYKLIRLFKSNVFTINEIEELWGERCGLDIEYVHVEDINSHLLCLANSLNLFADYRLETFVLSLDPQENWKFCLDKKDFQTVLLSRLISLFRLTEVSKLTGWEKWYQPR